MKLVATMMASVVVLALIVLLMIGVIRTDNTVHSDDQRRFVRGQVPSPQPDGLYRGSAEGYAGSWRGKKFTAATGTGINIFDSGRSSFEQYPFHTSVGKGLKDRDLDVLAIDYDMVGNPFWLRPVLDEVVEVEPGMLLGKLQYRLIPDHPFTLAFFRLQK